MPPSGAVIYEARTSLAGDDDAATRNIDDKNNIIMFMLENGKQQQTHQQQHHDHHQFMLQRCDADITRRNSMMVVTSQEAQNKKTMECCLPKYNDEEQDMSKKKQRRRRNTGKRPQGFLRITSFRFVNIIFLSMLLFVLYNKRKVYIINDHNIVPNIAVTNSREEDTAIGMVGEYNENKLIQNIVDEPSTTPESDERIIHVIHTRFMQDQPELIDLGLARLELLKAFPLISLKQQTSQNFVWIIRTDPVLNERLKRLLIDELESSYDGGDHHLHNHHRYLLIASNDNPNIQFDDILHSLTEEMVLSGNYTEAMEYLSLGATAKTTTTNGGGDGSGSSNVVVLESRLDSDDSLHKDFVESVQTNAKTYFSSSSSLSLSVQEEEEEQSVADAPSWKVWCASRHVEWQYRSMFREKTTTTTNKSPPEEEVDDDIGALFMIKDSECITTGLTIGYVPAVASNTVADNEVEHLHHHKGIPPLKHQQLAKIVPSCNKKQRFECRDKFDLRLPGLRARTPTSAGMLNILLKQHSGKSTLKKYVKAGAKEQEAFQFPLWRTVEVGFGFSEKIAVSFHSYVSKNMRAIAMDNLKGQCTAGHSCKQSSKEILQLIIDHPEYV